MTLPLEPISLGGACATKFQACRTLYLRAYPQGSVERLREALLYKMVADVFTRHVFDWQITPYAALLAYLEQDFAGVFEREDLFVDDDGIVVHRRLGTRHPHDFHGDAGPMTPAALDAQYPAARAKFAHLAVKFLDHLRQPGPFLYICSGAPDRSQAVRLIAQLSRHAGHQFQLLFVMPGPADALAGLDPRAACVVQQPGVDKPPTQQWEGDDGDWDRIFSGLDVGLPRGPAFTANLNPIDAVDPARLTGTGLEWRLLPGWIAAGPLPRVFTIPATPWDYAAMSSPLPAVAGEGTRTAYLDIEALEGRVGVTLMRPDGSELIGPEYCVMPQEGVVRLPLRFKADTGPVTILLRNFGFEGAAAAARVDAVWTVDEP